MTTRFACVLSAMLLILASPLLSSAEESSWKLPNLNPFSAKGKPPTASRTSGAKSAGWRMPKLWPSTSGAKRPTNQPSTLDKMTTGTKQFFSKTADALNPWDDENDNRVQRPSGSNSAFSRATKKPKESSGSSLLPASWWSSDEKDDRDKTVTDFLSRPRPGN